ncbi:ABC transporter ATP-binding protein [Halocatena marina]|uniref:ABC transporter ATP-binding protein n=1 Tax=Halocatena marina TaxID=2934937 RepID=UPI00200E3D18|nr:ABC transporter ATP-binding protein [Halocatena marina]
MMDEAAADLTNDASTDYPLLELVRQYGRADSHYLMGAVGSAAVKSFIGFADVFLIGIAIDALFNDQPLALPLLPDAWIPTATEPLLTLVFVGTLVIAVNAVTVFGGALAEFSFGVFAQRILHRIRVHAFDAAQHRRLDYFDAHRTGDVMSALNDDINQLESFFAVLISATVWIVVTLVAAIVYMSVLNWQLAVFVLLSGPFIAVLNSWFSRRIEPLQDGVRRERGALNALLETSLDGIGVVKAFTGEAHEYDRVESASRDHVRARFRSRRLAVRQAPLNRLVAGMWLLATLAIGVYWILVGPPVLFTGSLTTGELVPFLFYMERITLPLKNLSGVIDGYTSAKAAAKRIDGVTDGESEGECEIADDTSNNGFTVENGHVCFENVTFHYSNGAQPAIESVSFAVESGETVGVVGATGAGKSTAVKLLLGLYDSDDGTITIDGEDIRNVPVRCLRSAIGYVNQDAFLFNDTVRYNIAYGADGAVSDEQVREAARLAGVHDDITELLRGYDTEVGERGTSLSGGQRQRIAIARAVVDDPEILILDEATSHVDTKTERIIQDQLSDLVADRTTCVIAHRLSTVRTADRILVLDDGEIVERGTHEELLEYDGTYATLWNVQIGIADASTA